MDLFKLFRKDEKDGAETSASASEPRHLTGQEFDAVILESAAPVVVDFWAEWCGPCHAIAPAVARLASEFHDRAIIAKLNADDHPEILARYGVMGIPTVMYFKNGEEAARVVGMTGYKTLKDKLEQLLSE
jgi:thioredoxin 1